MKLLRDEMVRAGDEKPLDLFRQGIRAKASLYRYTQSLRQVVCEFLEEWLEGTFEERVAQLVKHGKDDPEWTRDLLINLSRKLRERTELAKGDPDYLNPGSFGNYFNPVKKLFDMNDIALSWKRIYSTYPEQDNLPDTAGWTREEIAKILSHARDAQTRAIILVLASSGVRAGAMDALNWGDLTPIYRTNKELVLDPGEGEVACAMLEVYRGSSEAYTTFVTPEAFAALQDYGRSWAEIMGRQAGQDDPMFVINRGVPHRMAPLSIRRRVLAAVVDAGLRGQVGESKRYKVPLMNGFRRFWNKTCKEVLSGDSTLGSLIKKEYMMGHRGLTSLDENYFKTDALELAREYVTAVPDLTIDDSDRLRLSNRRMADNVRRLEGEKGVEMARIQEEMAALKRENKEMAARLNGEKGEKDEEMSRLREEVAELKKRRDPSLADVLAALRNSGETDGISKDVVDSLAGVFGQLDIAKKAAAAEVRGEYDAKLTKVLNVVDWMAKKSGLQYDIRAELAETAGDDEPPETFPENPRDRGLC